VAFLIGRKNVIEEEKKRTTENVTKENLSREEVIAAIRACTEKLGRVPNRVELMKHTGLTRHDVNRYFGNYMLALKECNLEKTGSGMKIDMDRLFRDWTRVVRTLKALPKVYQFESESRYSIRPFRRLFGPWRNVPDGMKRYALERRLTDDWQDVMELIDGQAKGEADGQKTVGSSSDSKILAGRPMYGQLIRPFPLVCAPVNEFGVIFLFGALAEQMGFLVLRIQGQYPDGEAFRVVAEGRLQRVKIEFELESRNFLRHGHDPAKADLIVCWENNWPECPLEVIELKKVIAAADLRR
jgi:hypothetical protein